MNRRIAYFAGVGAFAVTAMAGVAQAQSAAAAGPVSSAPASAQPAGTQIEEVVVTARKIEENVQNIPVAVTALSEKTLTQTNFRAVRDLPGLVPSLNVRTDSNSPGGGALIGLRGQAPPDTTLTVDPAVAVYGDNVLLPRSYGLHNAMIDVSRIEVLRGPQGTLYGKNTDGGAVNFITNDPGSKFGASVDATVGNFGSASVLGIANLPISDTAGFRIVLSHAYSGAYGTDGLGRGLGWDDDTYLRAKFRGVWGPLTVRAFADYNKDSNGGAVVRLGGLTATGGLLASEAVAEGGSLALLKSYIGGNPYHTHGTFDSDGGDSARDAGLDLTYDITNDIKVRSITGYRWFDTKSPIDLDGTPFDGTQPIRGANDEFYSEELQLLGGDDKFNWVAGGYGSWESGQELSTTQTAEALSLPAGVKNATNGDVKSSSYAVFAQANWRFAPRWSLTAGARYTSESQTLISFNQKQVNGVLTSCSVPADLLATPGGACVSRPLSNTFTQPTWTASLTYEVVDNTSVYVKASHGFRSGGENYRGAVVDFSYQDFLPETVNEYEVGLKSELFDRRVRLNIAGFHDDMANVQRTVIIGVTSGGSTQTATVVTNAATAKINGFEVEGTWRVTHAFTVNGSVGYISPKYIKFSDFTGDRSHEAWPTPDWTYNINATYVVPTSVGDVSTTLSWSGQSSQDLSPSSKLASQVTQPAYGLLNGRISLDIPSQDVTMSLYVRNMLDKSYYAAAVGLESIGFNTVIMGEPRMFGFEIVKRFGGI